MNGSEVSSDAPARLARACCTAVHDHLTQPGVSFRGLGNTPRRTNSSTVLSLTSSAVARVALLAVNRWMSAGVRLIGRIVSVGRSAWQATSAHGSQNPRNRGPTKGNGFRALPPCQGGISNKIRGTKSAANQADPCWCKARLRRNRVHKDVFAYAHIYRIPMSLLPDSHKGSSGYSRLSLFTL